MAKSLLVHSICECERSNVVNTAKSTYDRNKYFLHVYLIINVYNCDNTIKSTYLKGIIFNGLENDDVEINLFSLNFLIYIGFKTPIHKLHSLFVTEEIDICKYAKRAVDSMDDYLRNELLKILNNINTKFIDVINNLIDKCERTRLWVFLLLYEYPCLLRNIREDYGNVVNFLLKHIFVDDDILFCAVLGCISRVLESISLNYTMDYKTVIADVILESSVPNVSLVIKLTAAQFLVTNKRFLFEKSCVFYGKLNSSL